MQMAHTRANTHAGTRAAALHAATSLGDQPASGRARRVVAVERRWYETWATQTSAHEAAL